MKWFTVYHVVAFFSVMFLLLCIESILDATSMLGFGLICAAVLGGAVLLWRHGENTLYYHNKNYARRQRRKAMRNDSAQPESREKNGHDHAA